MFRRTSDSTNLIIFVLGISKLDVNGTFSSLGMEFAWKRWMEGFGECTFATLWRDALFIAYCTQMHWSQSQLRYYSKTSSNIIISEEHNFKGTYVLQKNLKIKCSSLVLLGESQCIVTKAIWYQFISLSSHKWLAAIVCSCSYCCLINGFN